MERLEIQLLIGRDVSRYSLVRFDGISALTSKTGPLEIEYRVYDANDEFYASASGPNAEVEARRYAEQPGDYITKAYIIEERI